MPKFQFCSEVANQGGSQGVDHRTDSVNHRMHEEEDASFGIREGMELDLRSNLEGRQTQV